MQQAPPSGDTQADLAAELLRKLRGSAATPGLEGTVSRAADWVAMSISALVLDRSEWAAWLNPQSAEEGLLQAESTGILEGRES